MKILDILNKGITGSIIGIVGIVIGIVISYFFYRRSQIGARPTYQMASLRVIGSASKMFEKDELQISYLGKQVQRITKTQIVIWNSGTRLINGSDIIPNDQVRLKFSADSEVLNMSVISYSRKVNNFNMHVNPDECNIVTCTFDFLDPQDGVIIEILHTDARKYPEFSGTIKGIPTGFENRGATSFPLADKQPKSKKTSVKAALFWVIMGILVISLFVFIIMTSETKASLFTSFSGLFLGILSGIASRIYRNRKKFPRALIKNIVE